MKYTIKVKDPDGKLRRLVVYEDCPLQKFTRGEWEITLTAIKRCNGIMVDKIEWQKNWDI